tara:strand:+ start:1081 stop:1788 length:708 start_codon:yes stop_codon:yes gene_type:complete
MSAEGSVLVGSMLWAQSLWHYFKPRRVGVYGPTMVGKTTLDLYMATPGEMDEEIERTTHTKFLGKHLLPKPTRKRVSWDTKRRVIYSSDIGGEERFWNLWVDDMVDRQVEAVVYMFDHRIQKEGAAAVEAVAGFTYLTDVLLKRQYRYRRLRTRLKGKRYAPRMIMLVANKADQWWDDKASVLWQQNRINEHTMFDRFRPDLIRLQKAGIKTKRSFMATKIGWQVEPTLIDLLTT